MRAQPDNTGGLPQTNQNNTFSRVVGMAAAVREYCELQGDEETKNISADEVECIDDGPVVQLPFRCPVSLLIAFHLIAPTLATSLSYIHILCVYSKQTQNPCKWVLITKALWLRCGTQLVQPEDVKGALPAGKLVEKCCDVAACKQCLETVGLRFHRQRDRR